MQKKLIGAALIVGALAVGGYLFVRSQGPTPQGAAVACEKMVEQRVGRSLTFADTDEYDARELPSGNFEVLSWYVEPVDGSRTNFRCEVEPFEDSKGKGYRPVAIKSDR